MSLLLSNADYQRVMESQSVPTALSPRLREILSVAAQRNEAEGERKMSPKSFSSMFAPSQTSLSLENASASSMNGEPSKVVEQIVVDAQKAKSELEMASELAAQKASVAAQAATMSSQATASAQAAVKNLQSVQKITQERIEDAKSVVSNELGAKTGEEVEKVLSAPASENSVASMLSNVSEKQTSSLSEEDLKLLSPVERTLPENIQQIMVDLKRTEQKRASRASRSLSSPPKAQSFAPEPQPQSQAPQSTAESIVEKFKNIARDAIMSNRSASGGGEMMSSSSVPSSSSMSQYQSSPRKYSVTASPAAPSFMSEREGEEVGGGKSMLSSPSEKWSKMWSGGGMQLKNMNEVAGQVVKEVEMAMEMKLECLGFRVAGHMFVENGDSVRGKMIKVYTSCGHKAWVFLDAVGHLECSESDHTVYVVDEKAEFDQASIEKYAQSLRECETTTMALECDGSVCVVDLEPKRQSQRKVFTLAKEAAKAASNVVFAYPVIHATEIFANPHAARVHISNASIRLRQAAKHGISLDLLRLENRLLHEARNVAGARAHFSHTIQRMESSMHQLHDYLSCRVPCETEEQYDIRREKIGLNISARHEKIEEIACRAAMVNQSIQWIDLVAAVVREAEDFLSEAQCWDEFAHFSELAAESQS